MPSYKDVEAASRRIAPYVTRTPLLENKRLNEQLGCRLLLKAESLQRTGSFKIRGASNRIAQLSPAEKAQGVVAYSSGNHAQGVAMAARNFSIKATIVMPKDAPAAKIDGTKAFGAEIVFYDRYSQSREEIGAALVEKTGAVLVPPFNHQDIIAGQGTAGLEICEQARDLDADLDGFIVPASGGGLASGCGIALRQHFPNITLRVAEPEFYDDLRRSLAAGHLIGNEGTGSSICDALLLNKAGDLTFPILRSYGYSGVAVTDNEVRSAMRVGFDAFKLVIEPGGAAALASVLAGKVDVEGKTICVIATGGNVDPMLFRDVLEN